MPPLAFGKLLKYLISTNRFKFEANVQRFKYVPYFPYQPFLICFSLAKYWRLFFSFDPDMLTCNYRWSSLIRKYGLYYSLTDKPGGYWDRQKTLWYTLVHFRALLFVAVTQELTKISINNDSKRVFIRFFIIYLL